MLYQTKNHWDVLWNIVQDVRQLLLQKLLNNVSETNLVVTDDDQRYWLLFYNKTFDDVMIIPFHNDRHRPLVLIVGTYF